MSALRILGALLLAVLLLGAAGACYLIVERWPTREREDPHGRMPKGWQPDPRTVVRIV